MQTASKKYNVNLAKCENKINFIQNEVDSLISESTYCITDRINQVNDRMIPLQTKVNELKEMFNHLLLVNAECVSDHEAWVVSKIGCLIKVREKSFLKSKKCILN